MIQRPTCYYSSTPAVVSAAVDIHGSSAQQSCENRLCTEASRFHFDHQVHSKKLTFKNNNNNKNPEDFEQEGVGGGKPQALFGSAWVKISIGSKCLWYFSNV